MPEAPIDSEQTTSRSVGNSDVDFDSVCVDVPRIYDSCGAKDCLSDLPVFFTPQNQSIVNNATSVRINKASVSNATVKVDSVAFHTGFYCVDMVFYFSVCCDVYSGKGALPTTVNGVATYGKRVVLYGSSGNLLFSRKGKYAACYGKHIKPDGAFRKTCMCKTVDKCAVCS